MFKDIENMYGGVDVCINNAGMAYNAPLLTGKTEDWRDMLNVSVVYVGVVAWSKHLNMFNSLLKLYEIQSVHFHLEVQLRMRNTLKQQTCVSTNSCTARYEFIITVTIRSHSTNVLYS